MLVSNEVLCLLHPTYQNAIQNLEKQWELYEDTKSRIDLLIAFSNNFLMVSQLWSELFCLTDVECPWEKQKEIMKAAYFHFYYVNENSPNFRSGYKILYQPLNFSFSEDIYEISGLNKMVKNFGYPHKSLDAYLRTYEEYISSPIKKDVLDRFKQSKKLYYEILTCEDDLKLWFQNIIRVDDEMFIANNIEYRLGKNLDNLDLWKMYFEYLKGVNPTKLLTLYSKYCRYFTNDEAMKEEYQKATKMYGPSYVIWQNKYDFETFGRNQRTEIPESEEAEEIKKLSPAVKGEFKHFINQNFSLPKTMINYIMQHYSIHQKLFQTCKYFFFATQIPVFHNLICKSLHWKEGVQFKEQSVAILFPSRQSIFSKNARIHFDHKFIILNSLNVTFHNDSNILSTSIIPNIFRCSARFIRLQDQNLTLKEFKFLTENNTVEMLHLDTTRIYKNDKTLASMEEILEYVPKITVFEIFSPITSSQTFEKLQKLKFVNKIDIFKMFELTYFERKQ